MAFKPEAVQPDFSSLIVSLDNSKTQLSNYSLYQTIFFLIQNTARSRDLILDSIDTINEQVSAVIAASFLTAEDETNTLPNSRQLLAGVGIIFNDAIAGQRTISAVSTELPVGTVFSTWINSNPGVLLGYGTWILFATGTGTSGNPLLLTVT